MANTRVATPTLAGSLIATIRKKEWTAASRTYVARLCLIVSLALEVIQKTQDRRGIHIECMEHRWLFVCCLPQKLQQEPERVPVAFHRSSTRPLLPIKVIDEECLEQRAYWRLTGSHNGLHC
jgi:hypothetical protein